MSAKKYSVICPVHGAHEVTQATRPTICKQQVRFGKRSIRQCRRELRAVAPVQEVKP